VTPAPRGPWSAPDLPTDAAAWRAVAGPDAPWREVEVVPTTASTNSDLLARADAGAGSGLVLVAQEQTAGRGRLDRTWESPPGTGLTFSVLVEPWTDRGAWGWLPLLSGLAVAEAIRERSGLTAGLKWPNDVLIDERKVAGVLVQVTADARRAVVGIGINTHLGQQDLPIPEATSLMLAGADEAGADRSGLLRAVLLRLAARLGAGGGAGGAAAPPAPEPAAMADYRRRCVTLGRHVDVAGAVGRHVRGVAADVADDGSLVVDVDGDGVAHVASGDVVHVR
jgi:BirA family transcriptional regulator, biotin operon repressor / biotin---[acetyl-CoA-carboxylase] ligase